MKKSLTILSLLCLALPLMAQNNAEPEEKGAHPFKVEENKHVAPTFSHWTLAPHIGFNMFDGDFNSEMMHNLAVPSAGLSLEYAFTPVWSMGIEYMYSMYTVTGRPNSNNADTLLYGHLHRAGAFIAMDLVNLFFPNSEKKIVSIMPYVGGGIAFYKRSKYYMDNRYYDAEKGKVMNPTHERGNTLNYINANGEVGPDFDTAYSHLGYLAAGVNVEFNVSRYFALGIRANYSYFTRDYLDGRGYSRNPVSYASKNNDGLFDVTLNLRIKFASVSDTHVRNISAKEVWTEPEFAKSGHCCHDTIIVKHDSIVVREKIVESKGKDMEKLYYVYFANNKSQIDANGLITIQQVADRLAEDTTLYAVVTGYCDNTGSTKLNFALGDKRADNVADELREEHGISSDHLYSTGMGKLVGHRSQAAYGPNRRAVIRLVDKATFDRLKAELEDKRANRIEEEDSEDEEPAMRPGRPVRYAEPEPEEEIEPVETVPLSESARPVKQNTYKQRTNEEVVSEPSTTLSKLARQYYNNTYCWVYIYIANKDKIKNPNHIPTGTTLIIPELTEEEMRITKDQGLVLYGNARQER